MTNSDADLFSTQTVLVVDDDADMRDYLRAVIEPWASVVTAANGDEALDLARMAMPDLILLDVQMPGMDGFDVINELKHDTTVRHIPVIFITATTLPEIESECLEAGAADYISKPINPRVLTARARTHLMLKQQADQLSELAVVDGTTGALNRRAFDGRLVAEHGRMRRTGESLSLVLVDVDQFADYNGTYGHLAGDDVLAAVTRVLGDAAQRSTDVVGRIDGDRLALLLPGANAEVARRIAEQVRDAVRALGITHRHRPSGTVTVSVGVADAVGTAVAGELMTAAQHDLDGTSGPRPGPRALHHMLP
jgi:diguanylate cyclase (GGDEF)-like protein